MKKADNELCLKPLNVAETVSTICITKAKGKTINIIILGFLAGAFIAFGGELSTMVATGTSNLSIGISKFLAGSVFSVGLILVVIAGAELFTGNNLMVLSALDKKVSWLKVLNKWIIVYFANFVGAIFIVILMFYSGLWKTGANAWGVTAANIAVAKVNLTPIEAFFRAIGCNWLVCLAVWMAIASKDIVGKIFAIYFPIMAFVASGFEHIIANFYFIPIGFFLKGTVIASSVDMGSITLYNTILNNFIPVTLGNIIGGAFFVGFLYWWVYLKKDKNDKK